jgi:murein DD-endopeptidase MepM/ murein hydrolase activator NlpD
VSDSIILPSKPATPRYRLRADAKPVEDGAWVWPLPRLAGDTPAVTVHINDARRAVHVGYKRMSFTGLFVPVYAAQGGTISFAQRTSNGCAISIEHGGTWCTHYAHLQDMFVVPTYPARRRRARVRAGDVIGYAAANPIHVRFELWKWTDADGFVPDLAALRMRDWLVLPQHDTPPRKRVAA